MQTQTKAQLEAEIVLLRLRVSELEGAVEAYRYALAHQQPAPGTNVNDPGWWWNQNQWTFQPNTIFPNVVTS
jgi:hypothetical protein